MTERVNEGEHGGQRDSGSYRQLFLKSRRAVIICSRAGDRLRIDDLNFAARAMFSEDQAELVGSPAEELLPWQERESFASLANQVAEDGEGRVFSYEIRPVHGRTKGIELSLIPLEGNGLGVVFENDSRWQEVEKQLRRGRDEWERTFDGLSDIITILDLDMHIIRANMAACDTFGEQIGEVIGRKCYDFYQGASEPCAGCPVLNTRESRTVDTAVVYNKKLDKTFDVRSSPIFDSDGQVKWIVQVARDVTDEIERESQRYLLAAAIEQAQESVVITDRDGVLQYVNPAFTETSGYSREFAVGRSPSFLKSGLHDEQFYREMWEKMLSGQVWRGKIINRNNKGHLFREDATISPVYSPAGDITNFIAVKRDISREESLERQLQQAMKMEAIGTLAGGIAHDFNNILTAIIGYGYIAKGKVEFGDSVGDDIDQILAGAGRAVDLVKQILTFARQEDEEKLVPLKVQYIVKEVLKLLRSSLPTTIELKQYVDSGCGSIMAEPGQIHQVLMNICTNAKQAIGHEHGELSIGLEQKTHHELSGFLDDLAELDPGEYLHLQISDTGCGMEERLMDRVFDPFFTTRTKEHGTGLGLAVVHGIVKKHKGEILVHSTPGAGTTFHILFPVIDEEAGEGSSAEAVMAGGSERVMVVDDEDAVGVVMEKMLSSLGYSVFSHTDSLEAVQQFRENPDCCDLVLTDMTMPKMTGLELAREMLSLRPGLPIVMVTGYSEAIDKEKAVKIGIRDFLLKPVRKEQLSCALREVLASGQNSDN